MALVHIAHIYEGLANSVRTFPVLILYIQWSLKLYISVRVNL